MITVYTDGACSLGVGGWAWWVNDACHDSGAVLKTTNNAMEMIAVIQALHTKKVHWPDDELLIVSDSAYVVNCFRERWYDNWRRNGWIGSSKKPVANRDLWERMLGLMEGHEVRFLHVRGHGRGDARRQARDAPHRHGNDMADRLAVAARLKALDR